MSQAPEKYALTGPRLAIASVTLLMVDLVSAAIGSITMDEGYTRFVHHLGAVNFFAVIYLVGLFRVAWGSREVKRTPVRNFIWRWRRAYAIAKQEKLEVKPESQERTTSVDMTGSGKYLIHCAKCGVVVARPGDAYWYHGGEITCDCGHITIHRWGP